MKLDFKKMGIKGITLRWIKNSLGLLLLLIIAVAIGFTFFIRNYYYDSINQVLVSRADTIANYLDSFSNETNDFFTRSKDLVEDFADRDKMEFMMLDHRGRVLVSSSGFTPTSYQEYPDYTAALESDDHKGKYIGKNSETGEKVMAVSQILYDKDGRMLGAVRFIVSLERIDTQLVGTVLVTFIIGLSLMFFIVLSSSYFLNSIVQPVSEIGKSARRIASGDFDTRIEKKYDDEIGDLSDTINYMASELRANEVLKQEFMSSVSHELRTPLTAIKGWAETLKDCGPGEEQTFQKGMNVILNETDRLSQMVEELLDFSRIESGRFNMIMDKTDILAELDEAVLMYSERARREHIQLVYEQPESLPTVVCDNNRIKQVFVNILDNALKYSNQGDTVTVKAFAEENNVQVIISDTGCGIPPGDLPRIKEKFYKGNTTRRGSGIGLAVANEIMLQHGGFLDIQSEVGAGTTVTIALPIHQKTES